MPHVHTYEYVYVGNHVSAYTHISAGRVWGRKSEWLEMALGGESAVPLVCLKIRRFLWRTLVCPCCIHTFLLHNITFKTCVWFDEVQDGQSLPEQLLNWVKWSFLSLHCRNCLVISELIHRDKFLCVLLSSTGAFRTVTPDSPLCSTLSSVNPLSANNEIITNS